MKKVDIQKKIITRCLIGAPVGLAISTMITIIFSLAIDRKSVV